MFVTADIKFLIFLLLLSSFQAADAQSYKCPSPELTYTANSIFRRNLDDLLASLVNNVTSLPGFFYNTTVGSIPDRVYGLVQCHRDVSSGECRSCATSSASQLRQVCTNSKVAMFWRDDCFIRYSVYNFFGVVDKIQEEMENPNSISSPSRFEPFLLSFLRNLTASATTGGTSPVYVTGAVPYANSLTVYGLVECTGDLSPASCRSCLNNSIDGIRCCTDRVGARILSGSCVVRYEIYPFFANFSTATTLTPPATLPSTSSPPPATNWSASPAPLPALPLGKGGIGFWKILIVPIGGVLLVACILCFVRARKSHIEKVRYERETSLLDINGLNQNGTNHEVAMVRLRTVQTATDNFSESNKLGQGGFGPVYKSVLPSGQEIAVKRLSQYSAQGVREFKNEVKLIGNLQHKNLVRLLGCSLEKEEMLLIYEYLPNKSVDTFLSDPQKRVMLDWETRLNIMGGTARGMVYLHHDSRLSIIHRDLKAANVLLDELMNPKISDFGIFSGNQTQVNTKIIVGTYGYMAPEYAMDGFFSIKSDVYSFGVLLLEIISGQLTREFNQSHQEDRSLVGYAWSLWSQGMGLEFVDPLLKETCPPREPLKYLHIGLLCVQEDAESRPTMSSVLLMLGSEPLALPVPTEPAFSNKRTKGGFRRSQTSSVNGITDTEVTPR